MLKFMVKKLDAQLAQSSEVSEIPALKILGRRLRMVRARGQHGNVLPTPTSTPQKRLETTSRHEQRERSQAEDDRNSGPTQEELQRFKDIYLRFKERERTGSNKTSVLPAPLQHVHNLYFQQASRLTTCL